MELNPFTNRGMITNPNDFFGRKEQIDAIISRLHTMQSFSVVGERRIGKSSLLYYLAQTGTKLLGKSTYRLFYLDLQDAHFKTATGFLKAVLSRLGIPDSEISEKQSLNRNLVAFSHQIESLEQAGQQIILCLDEFENLFKHPDQFTEDFFDHLRSMLNRRKLALITATQHPLQDLSLAGKLTSPFYNVFTVVKLEEFTQDEACQFIEAYQQRVSFQPAELKFINAHLPFHPIKRLKFRSFAIG